MEAGESTREAAAREFHEETSLVDWSFRDGFERTLSYTYIRRGRKVVKTVTYYIVEVRDPSALALFPGACRRSVRTMVSLGDFSTRSASCSITPRSARFSPKPTPG